MRQFCRRTAPCDSGQMRLTVLDRETQACPLCRITGIRTLPRHKLRNNIGGPGSFRGNRAFFSARATDNSAGRLHAGSQNCPIFHAPPSLFHGGVRLPAPSAHTQPRLPAPSSHSRFGEPFATVCRCAAERNIHATACTFRSRFIANSPRAEETEKEGEDGEEEVARLPAPSAHTQPRHLRDALPRAERVHRRIHRGRKRPKKRIRTARGRGCEASRRLRHIRRTGGGGLQAGRHAAAGRGYLSRLKS